MDSQIIGGLAFHIDTVMSENAMYRTVSERERAAALAKGRKPRGKAKTKAYQGWLTAAGWQLRQQMTGQAAPQWDRPVELWLDISWPGRFDIGNMLKAAQDLLVLHDILADDNRDIVKRVHIADKTGAANWKGCRITVAPFAERLAA